MLSPMIMSKITGLTRRTSVRIATPSAPGEVAPSETADLGLFYALDAPKDPSASTSPIGAAGSSEGKGGMQSKEGNA